MLLQAVHGDHNEDIDNNGIPQLHVRADKLVVVVFLPHPLINLFSYLSVLQCTWKEVGELDVASENL